MLEAISYETTQGNGYAFMTELAFRVVAAGGRITELPIEFRDRRWGTSKRSGRITVESMGRVSWWGAQEKIRRLRPGHRRTVAGTPPA